MSNIIKPSIEFIKGNDEEDIIKNIEKIARTCYKSEDLITETSGKKMIKSLISKEHFAMFDHENITYKVICDRGVSHEIVRHRIGAYAQESTRYCNYNSGKFGSEISVIDISSGFNYNLSEEEDIVKLTEWMNAINDAEKHYNRLIELGAKPEEARSVLPNSLKTEIVITYDISEWVHFMKLRYYGTTGKPHPQMKEIANLIRLDMIKRYPFIFGECANFTKIV